MRRKTVGGILRSVQQRREGFLAEEEQKGGDSIDKGSRAEDFHFHRNLL